MGLLEKASNIEAEEKPPKTKVVKPKKEAVKEPPAAKPKKAAKKPKKVKPKKEKKPRAPRVKKEIPEGFEPATTGQKVTRRIFDFAVSYGWTLPLIGISAWGSNFNPTIIVILGIGLISFNLGFMPTYAGKRTVGNWISRTQYINSRGEPPLSIYLAIKGMTTIFVLFGVFTLLLVMANGSLGKSTFSQIFSAIGFLIAAKSIFRFGDLTKHQDRKLTEYVLLGTFTSVAMTFAIGLACAAALGQLPIKS